MTHKFIFLLLYLSIFSYANAFVTNSHVIEDNAKKIDFFFEEPFDALPNQRVISISQNIIKNRSSYSNNTLAKLFIMLTNIAYSESEDSKGYQLAYDGLTLSGVNTNLRLELLVNAVKGHYKESNFQNVLDKSNEIINLSQESQYQEFSMVALAYQTMALYELNQFDKSLKSLKNIESLISKNPNSKKITLLELLAEAYLTLNKYQSAIDIFNKSIKLRFEKKQFKNLGQAYLLLALAYQYSDKLDDAYNAYWQANAHAEEFNLPVQGALSQLGLGEILLLQNLPEDAYSSLFKAYNILSNSDLVKPYVNVLISMAKAAVLTNREEAAYQWLITAKKLTEGLTLTPKQIELYSLLAVMENNRGLFKLAFTYQKKYSTLFKVHYDESNFQKKSMFNDLHIKDQTAGIDKILSIPNNNNFSHSNKIEKQKTIIFLLSISLIFIVTTVVIWLFRRIYKPSFSNAPENENTLASPNQTKRLYQSSFKMARKYQYPLTVSYLVIDNWNELVFHFNKKTVSEVHKTISTLIYAYITEFDHAGKINDGEYILICPHQTCEDIKLKLDKLAEALKVRFFANVGDFSIKMRYICDTPTIQDIDPYLFLSRLSENNTNKNQQK